MSTVVDNRHPDQEGAEFWARHESEMCREKIALYVYSRMYSSLKSKNCQTVQEPNAEHRLCEEITSRGRQDWELKILFQEMFGYNQNIQTVALLGSTVSPNARRIYNSYETVLAKYAMNQSISC